jgi:outer membrane protein TolC
MFKIKYFFAFLVAIALFVQPLLAHAQSTEAQQELSLFDCYQLALKQSERVAIQQQLIKEAEAHFQQSFSGILPKVSYEYSETRQNGSGNTNFTLRQIPEGRFIFSQPLFSGFKEFAGMAASRAERRQREQETLRAKQLLFTDVSDAF